MAHTYATIYFLQIVLPMQPHYVPLSKMDFKQSFVKLLKLTGKKFRQISYLVVGRAKRGQQVYFARIGSNRKK